MPRISQVRTEAHRREALLLLATKRGWLFYAGVVDPTAPAQVMRYRVMLTTGSGEPTERILPASPPAAVEWYVRGLADAHGELSLIDELAL